MIEDQVTHNLKPHWAKSLGSSLAGCMPCAPHLGFGETKVNAYMVVGCALDSIELKPMQGNGVVYLFYSNNQQRSCWVMSCNWVLAINDRLVSRKVDHD
jgi:hypothetical protein